MSFIEIPKTDREAWLKWRQSGIGSSDVPVIMGVSRYKTYDQLLEEKVNMITKEDPKNGYIKDRGNRVEALVRRFYEEKMGMTFSPMSCQSKDNPHLLCTLDGIDEGRNLIIEIKLMSTQKEGKPNYKAEGYNKWHRAKTYNLIPNDYWPQIQHQLAITGVPACIFLGYKEIKYKDHKSRPVTEDDLAIVSVLPDEYYISMMNEKISEFWKKVLQKREELAIVSKQGEDYDKNSDTTRAG